MKKNAEQLVNEIGDFVNNFNDNSKDFNAQMERQHRTLQQSFTGLCFKWLEYVASDAYQVDLRNESSKQMATLMVKLMSEHFSKLGYTSLPSQHLPLI